MSDLDQELKQIVSIWKGVFEKANPTPVVWKPHWPNGDIVVLNEMVEMLRWWIERIRAPSGFSAGFQLAKILVATSLPSMMSTVRQLEAGQYPHLPSFAAQVQDALSKIHSMVVYSDKHNNEHAMADLSAQLTQALSMLDTAQSELAQKEAALRKADELYQSIRNNHDDAETLLSTLKIIGEEASTLNKDLHSSSVSAADDAKAAKEFADKLEELFVNESKKLSNLTSGLDSKNVELNEVFERTKRQSKIIDEVLPKGASAGLAAAFSKRGKDLNFMRNVWAGAFLVALLGIAGIALLFFFKPPAELATMEFWQRVALRITYASPLVWLGWVSAIQYGNIIRVQEDYAFKEATSLAFQGYRDHMQHLASIDEPSSRTALNLLAVETIKILAQDPLRIYEKSHADVSPAHGMRRWLPRWWYGPGNSEKPEGS